MIEVLKTLGYFSIGITAFIAIITFLGKKLIDWYLKKETNKFQSQLDKDLKLFEAGLKDSSTKYQITFSNLHTKRAEIITELYELIVNIETSLGMYIMIKDTNGELERNVFENLKAIKDKYFKTDIYFTDDTNKKIMFLMNTIVDVLANYTSHKFNKDDEKNKDENRQLLRDAHNAFANKMPELKNDLKNEYRKLLGVD